MPLIAGPAALTTILVLSGNPDFGYSWTLVGIVCSFAILAAALLLSGYIVRLVGTNALKAFSKLVMVLLAAIAVNFIRTGVAFFSLGLGFLEYFLFGLFSIIDSSLMIAGLLMVADGVLWYMPARKEQSEIPRCPVPINHRREG